MNLTPFPYFPVILLALVLGCASGDGQGGDSEVAQGVDGDVTAGESDFTGRVTLIGLQTDDSTTGIVTTPIVDGMLRQALDSLDAIEYVPVAESGLAGADSVALQDLEGIDGGIALRVARLGGIIGVDLRIIDPKTSEVLYHDRAFSFLRFREEDGTMLLGPGLYEAIYRHVLRIGNRRVGLMPDSRAIVANAVPLIITSVEIPRDSSLGRILENRIDISKDGVRALGDFVRYTFNEFVVFDYASRSRLYELVGLGMVEDHAPTGNLERRAMFGADLPYFLSTGIRMKGSDSVEIVSRIHRVIGPESDVVVDSAARRYDALLFETTTTTRDAIAEVLDVTQELLRGVVDEVRAGNELK